jgi:hypothetical protein
MTVLQLFKQAVGLPESFDVDHPYARLAFVSEGQEAGADADVEYREQDGGRDQVVVTVLDWERERGQTRRGDRRVVVFDAQTGAVLSPDDQDDPLADLLVAMRGMELVKEAE